MADNEIIELIPNDHEMAPYGPGWAWDDYIYPFQSQKSWWPIYGNVVQIKKADSTILVYPNFFEPYVDIVNQPNTEKQADRALYFNKFTAFIPNDTSAFEESIPFEYSDDLFVELLKDTLAAEISFGAAETPLMDTLFSQPLDTVLARMMKPSDNFMAEQLFIMSAWKNKFHSQKEFRRYVLDVWLSELGEMVWVDGSGLSRYNLIAPIDQVRLLKKCIEEFGWDRITKILPTGGEGTLSELYLSEEPYIFAKTGTLSNNHNLSGLLVTNSGKRLLFSFMNNHYSGSSAEIKKAMEAFLMEIKEAY